MKARNILMALGLGALLFGCTDTKEPQVDPALVPQVSEISPEEGARAGDILTITGTKLNLVKEVRFGTRTLIRAEYFQSQSATRITVAIPDEAPSGEVYVIAKADVVPNVLAGTIALRLPTATDVDPIRVNTGSVITITGTDLDLTAGVKIGNGSLEDVQIIDETTVKAKVPQGITAGFLKLVAKSGEESTYPDPIQITVVPTITMVTDGYVRGQITIVGTNLNVVERVELATSLSITDFVTQTETNLTIAVPATATQGTVKLTVFSQDAPTGVESPEFSISLAQPTITAVTNGYVGNNVTITGTLLDYVTKVTFATGKDVTTFSAHTATAITVRVPDDATVGSVTLTVTTADAVTAISPTFTIEAGFDPTAYIFFDFDGKGSWWGDLGNFGGIMPGTDPNNYNGTNFAHFNATQDGGWAGLFFRNGGNDLNLSGVTVADWGWTMMVKVIAADAGVGFKLRLGNSWGFFYPDAYVGQGWVRVYISLASFKGNDGTGADMTQAELDAMASAGDFGMCTGVTAGLSNVCIDNIGFAPMPASPAPRRR